MLFKLGQVDTEMGECDAPHVRYEAQPNVERNEVAKQYRSD